MVLASYDDSSVRIIDSSSAETLVRARVWPGYAGRRTALQGTCVHLSGALPSCRIAPRRLRCHRS